MTRKTQIIIHTLCCVLLATSGCRTYEEPTVTAGVLDGRIGTDGFPMVILTRALSPDETDIPLADKLVRWAKVTVSDGETETVLTGGMNNAMFPPYRYYCYDMVGKPGKRYTVHAVCDDIDISASAVMPNPTPIEKITVEKLKDKEGKFAMTLYFTSPDDGPAYYYVTMRQTIKARSLPAFLGTVETGKESGMSCSVPLMRPKIRIDSIDYEPYFLSGEEWEITLNRVNKDEFIYWRNYDNTLITGSTPFVGGGENLKGNVKGGYGIWSVCGSTSRLVTVPRDSMYYSDKISGRLRNGSW